MLGGGHGLTIDGMAVGGPAYNCQELSQGDMIVRVDNDLVDADNCHEKLIGNDVPGSIVRLSVRCAASKQIKNVTLTRMSSTSMLDNVRMFEIFTLLKDHAFARRDKFSIGQIDEGIELWTARLHREQQEAYQVCDMKNESKKILSDLRKALRVQKIEGASWDGQEGPNVSPMISRTRNFNKLEASLNGQAVADENLCVDSSYDRDNVRVSGVNSGEGAGGGHHRRVSPERTAGRLALKKLLEKMEYGIKP